MSQSAHMAAAIAECRSRIPFPDLLLAIGAATAINRDAPSVELAFYACPVCGRTHITGDVPISPAILVDQQWSHFLMAPVRERDTCSAS